MPQCSSRLLVRVALQKNLFDSIVSCVFHDCFAEQIADMFALMTRRDRHLCQFVGLFFVMIFERTTSDDCTIIQGNEDLSALFYYLVNMRECLDV